MRQVQAELAQLRQQEVVLQPEAEILLDFPQFSPLGKGAT
jgi:hypothetical protein